MSELRIAVVLGSTHPGRYESNLRAPVNADDSPLLFRSEDQPQFLALLRGAAIQELGTLFAPVNTPVAVGVVRAESVEGGEHVPGVDGSHDGFLVLTWWGRTRTGGVRRAGTSAG